MSKKHDKNLRKKYKVINWPDYEASLIHRGNVTFWMTDEAIATWVPNKNNKRGGQPKYSVLAIETATIIRLLFSKRLRQTEGFLKSIIKLMGLNLPVPDHTTLSRRMEKLEIAKKVIEKKIRTGSINILIDSSGIKIYGEGEWNEFKHCQNQRKTWRKLHLAIDDEGEIVAKELTENNVGDSSCVDKLLDQIDQRIDTVYADGGYDGALVHE